MGVIGGLFPPVLILTFTFGSHSVEWQGNKDSTLVTYTESNIFVGDAFDNARQVQDVDSW